MYMEYEDNLKTLFITALIFILVEGIIFTKIIIDLSIYRSCYIDPNSNFYNEHEALCELYKDY